jgi:hypothetical protein
VLGGEPPPAIMLGTLVDEFEKIMRASLAVVQEREWPANSALHRPRGRGRQPA